MFSRAAVDGTGERNRGGPVSARIDGTKPGGHGGGGGWGWHWRAEPGRAGIGSNRRKNTWRRWRRRRGRSKRGEKGSRGAVGVAGVLCSTGRWRLNWEALCGIAGIVAGCLVLLAPFRVPIRKPDESG